MYRTLVADDDFLVRSYLKTLDSWENPISANHSIILCKNGYKIGKTEWFSFSGTVL